MNTTLITILITEIIITGAIICVLLRLNRTVNNWRKVVVAQNRKLKTTLPAIKEIMVLTQQYIKLWQEDFSKKVEACGNLLGELTVYYIMHKLFKNQYESFETGFGIIKLFW